MENNSRLADNPQCVYHNIRLLVVEENGHLLKTISKRMGETANEIDA